MLSLQERICHGQEQEDASRPSDACQKAKDASYPEMPTPDLVEAQEDKAEEKRLGVGSYQKESRGENREIEHGSPCRILSKILFHKLVEHNQDNQIARIRHDQASDEWAMREERADSLQERKEWKERSKGDMPGIALQGNRCVIPRVPAIPLREQGMQRKCIRAEICQGKERCKDREQSKDSVHYQVDRQDLPESIHPFIHTSKTCKHPNGNYARKRGAIDEHLHCTCHCDLCGPGVLHSTLAALRRAMRSLPQCISLISQGSVYADISYNKHWT